MRSPVPLTGFLLFGLTVMVPVVRYPGRVIPLLGM